MRSKGKRSGLVAAKFHCICRNKKNYYKRFDSLLTSPLVVHLLWQQDLNWHEFDMKSVLRYIFDCPCLHNKLTKNPSEARTISYNSLSSMSTRVSLLTLWVEYKIYPYIILGLGLEVACSLVTLSICLIFGHISSWKDVHFCMVVVPSYCCCESRDE